MKKTALISASVSALLMGNAFAQDTANDINNTQQNWANVRAELNGEIRNVTGEVSATAAAIGNSFSAELDGTTDLDNRQVLANSVDTKTVESSLYLGVTDQTGRLTATAAAIGNSASVTVNAPSWDSSGLSQISNTQIDLSGGTSADVSMSVNNIDEKLEITSAAINNSFSSDVTGNAEIANRQWTFGDASASSTLSIQDALGSVSSTTAAIGNSASVTIDNLDGSTSSVTNFQHANGTFEAEMIGDTSDIFSEDGYGNAIETTVAAMANSFSVEAQGDLESTNFQRFFGDVQASTDLSMNNISGDVSVTTAAIANSASYDIDQADSVNITNTQFADYDPTAVTNLNIANVEGENLDLTSAAISNTLSVSTLPSTPDLKVKSVQINGATTQAVMELSMNDVVGNVSMTAASIGNSVSIDNLTN